MQEILFIKTSSLGDVIHHMPAMTEARAHFPDARLSWVVEDAFVPLAKLHPAVDEVIPVSSRRWRKQLLSPFVWGDIRRFIVRLRAKQYDKIVDTQGLTRTGLIAKLARGERHGYDRDSIREKFASRFYNIRHQVPRDIHAVARNRALTGLALGYEPEGEPDYGLDRAALAGVPLRPYALLLHATAEKRKEWPEESWIALARAFEDRINLLLPWGSEAECDRAERIAGQLTHTQVPIRRELDDMARMIAGASFVVGVDTGLLHLAAALGVPVVGIFVGSERALTGPVGAGPIDILGARNAAPSAEEAIAAVENMMTKSVVPAN
ncbi:MAG TPA: lipopolysaccharide heptosyltransferase I [Xanthobacteraceae bacterium]|nr:lipopolysaccharide heptosyltransferase I [Xanthobacteraceae bacterium]